MTGKDICKELKAIRRNIAEENGIDLDIPECTYQGPCRGTCPRCESEVRILERELSRRLSLGKMATVAGIALTLAGGTAAADTPVVLQKGLPDCGLAQHRLTSMADAHLNDADSNYAFRFLVKDLKNDEPISFARVVVKRNGDIVAGTHSDLDGLATIKGLRDEEYDIEIRCVGYTTLDFQNLKPKPISELNSIPVALEMTTAATEGLIIVEVATAGQAEIITGKQTKAEARKAKKEARKNKKEARKKTKASVVPIIDIPEPLMMGLISDELQKIPDADSAAEPLNIEDKPHDIPVPSLPDDTED